MNLRNVQKNKLFFLTWNNQCQIMGACTFMKMYITKQNGEQYKKEIESRERDREKGGERDRERELERDRRQRERETERQGHRETDRETDSQTLKERQRD